jgi:hypothetical protein
MDGLTMSKACSSALSGAEFYEHAKTAKWNEAIIVRRPKRVACLADRVELPANDDLG